MDTGTQTTRSDYPEQAEAVVIARVLLGPEHMVEVEKLGLDPEDFFTPAYKTVFAEVLRQMQTFGKFDILSIADGLTQSKAIEAVGGYAGLMDIFTLSRNTYTTYELTDPALTKQRITAIMEAAKRRKAAIALANALQRLKDGDSSAAIKAVEAVADVTRNSRRAFTPITGEPATKALDELEREWKAHTHITGIRSGYYRLDHLTGGFQPNNVYIIAARPSMGKTALGLNIAQNIVYRPADQQHIPNVGIVSAEMPAHRLFRRILSSESGVDLREMVQGMNKEHMQHAMRATSRIRATKALSILEAHGMDIDTLSSLVRMQHIVQPFDILIVDYLQLIPGTSERALASTVDQVSEVSQKIHRLALSLNIPIIALAQLNRDATGKSPSIRDLKGSGAIEQDADVVILIDRPEKNLAADADQADRDALAGLTVLDIAKNRNGETGRVLLEFQPAIQRFTERNDQTLPAISIKTRHSSSRFRK